MGNDKKWLIWLLIAMQITVADAQVGLFFYASTDAKFNNNKIVYLNEAPNKEIYLLSKLSDDKFQNSKPGFMRVDKKGNKLFEKSIDGMNLFDVNRMIILPDQNINIYGNLQNNNKFTSYVNTITPEGKSKNIESKFSVYSAAFNDIVYIDDKTALIAETRYGKADLYNISIYLINLVTREQVWYKNINSEYNEEATQLLRLKDKNTIILGKKYNQDLTTYVPIVYKINANGDVLWRKGLTVPGNFFSQSISADETGVLYYICGYSRESTGTCETRLVVMNQDTDNTDYNIFQDISANGIIALNDGNFMIYGSNLLVSEGHVLTKAKYMIFNKKYEVIAENQLGMNDLPDTQILKNSPKSLPSTSDFSVAMQLSDNRIACGGKIYMPVNLAQPDNNRQNHALLLIMTPDGKFK